MCIRDSVWVYVPAHVQQWLHGVRDELVQRGRADRGDVLGECVRCVHSSHQRARRKLHGLIGIWVYVPAHVQQWLHGVRDELVQHGYIDRGDVLGGCVSCIHSSHQRQCRDVHEIAPIWGCLPAHVQQWLHCVWDVFMQSWDTYRRDVLGQSGSCGSQIHARNNICLLYTSPSPRDS